MAVNGKQGVVVLVALAAVASLSIGLWRAQLIRGMARVDANIHEVRADGRAFGAAVDPAACVDEGLRRGPGSCADGDLPCAAEAGIFLEGCLGDRVLSLAFCADVPAPDPQGDAREAAVAAWAASRCAEAGHADSRACARVLHDGLQRACHAAVDAPAPGDPALDDPSFDAEPEAERF